LLAHEGVANEVLAGSLDVIDLCAVDLLREDEMVGYNTNTGGQTTAIFRHRVEVVTHVVAEIQRCVGGAADTAASGGYPDVDTNGAHVGYLKDGETMSFVLRQRQVLHVESPYLPSL